MCILIIKPKGKNVPSRDILQRCFNKNPDGAGICFNDGKNVIIKKGFMTFDKFYKATLEIPKSSTAFLHCRIGTSGGNTQELTHPYSLCDNYKQMKKLNIKTDFAVAHNGVFSELGYEKDVNDTCIFIKKILYPLHKNSKNILDDDYDFIINRLLGYGSKIAIMDKDGNFKKYGNGWIEEDGILYSNSGYKKYEPFVYTTPHIWNWQDYYKKTKDDDYDYIEEYFNKNYKTKQEKNEIEQIKEKHPELINLIDDYLLYGFSVNEIKRDLLGEV